MIYPTVKECVEMCSRTGVLKVEGIRDDEYVLKKAGFRPRYVGGLEKAAVFFSLIPIIILA